ncbi:hypothetical protein AB0B89_27180 [Sphaerisporangium sp. NPDC049002]|uniref:hypothetical protein n=1 Tax=Sphaerisporangium sp. NPDC049002 TaxID=3155392 RepID=UPI0033C11547
MARFKNKSGDELHIGRADGRRVDAGEVIEVDGELTEEIDDAYIVGKGDDERAWPKETWELVKEAGKADKTGKEND